MQITETMDLYQIPDLLVKKYSPQEMHHLCGLLNKTSYKTLEDIPPEVWLSMLEEVKVHFLPG